MPYIITVKGKPKKYYKEYQGGPLNLILLTTKKSEAKVFKLKKEAKTAASDRKDFEIKKV